MTENPPSAGTDVGDHQAVHEARYPSRPGDDVPEGKAYDSMDSLLEDLDLPE
jgi:hypothetical protein